MNRKIIAAAVAAACATPPFSPAADINTDGFVDIVYTIQDEPADPAPGSTAKNPSNSKFSANGEVDFSAAPAEGVTARIDTDLALGVNGGTNACAVRNAGPCDSAVIEQAFFSWAVRGGVTLIGGVFNDPIGQDAEDVTNMNFTTHSVVYNILDNQTALYGNNVAGIAAAGALGPVNLTAAVLNDLGQANEKNSLALVAGGSPVKDLDLEIGYVSHDKQSVGGAATTAGGVWDLNGSYRVAGFTVGADYMAAEEIIDSAYDVWAGYVFGNGFAIRARYDAVGFSKGTGARDVSATTVYVSYQAAKNLKVALQFTSGDNGNYVKATNSDPTVAQPLTGIGDGNTSTLEFIGTF